MVNFNNTTNSYVIEAGGTSEDWLYTIRALCRLMASQDETMALSTSDTYRVATLIHDMLPSEDMAMKMIE